VPKNTLTLSSGDGIGHLIEDNGKINLKCEDLYTDFNDACNEVISMSCYPSTKMDSPLLYVPDIPDNTSYSGTTMN